MNELMNIKRICTVLYGAFLFLCSAYGGNRSNVACVVPCLDKVEITSIPWVDFDTRPLTSPLAKQAYDLYQQGLKYTVNDWYNRVKKFALQNGEYIDFGGKTEHFIRPVSHEAFALAVAFRWNIYDSGITGVSLAEAHKIAIRLIGSLAYRHKANSGEKEGWGKAWQSAWWTAQSCFAAWLMWDELNEADRENVYRMTVYEADRFLNYQPPYYKDLTGRVIYKGDSKSEENAWNSDLLVLASVMFPYHAHASRWHRKALELQISAYATPSDRYKKKKINGIRLNEFLQGSNLEEDGTVINHGIVHVDYMVAVVQNVMNILPYSIIGKAAPKASLFNAKRIYEALNQLPFDGQTMYVRDENGGPTPRVFFPEGNDWGTGNQVNYWLMDVMAHCYGWDKRVNPKASEWMWVRGEELKSKQARNANGTYYTDPKENSFPSREEFFLAEVAFGYLFLWTNEHRMTRFTNRAVW